MYTLRMNTQARAQGQPVRLHARGVGAGSGEGAGRGLGAALGRVRARKVSLHCLLWRKPQVSCWCVPHTWWSVRAVLLRRRCLQEAQDLCQPKAGTQPLSFKHKHAASTWTQFKLLMERNMTTHWRNPDYNFQRFVITIGLGLFLGILYLDRGSKT